MRKRVLDLQVENPESSPLLNTDEEIRELVTSNLFEINSSVRFRDSEGTLYWVFCDEGQYELVYRYKDALMFGVFEDIYLISGIFGESVDGIARFCWVEPSQEPNVN